MQHAVVVDDEEEGSCCCSELKFELSCSLIGESTRVNIDERIDGQEAQRSLSLVAVIHMMWFGTVNFNWFVECRLAPWFCLQ